jgi:hypothetical protein
MTDKGDDAVNGRSGYARLTMGANYPKLARSEVDYRD